VAEGYLAFDFGAESGRAILGNITEDNSLSITELSRFPNLMVVQNSHLHWNTRRMIEELYRSLRLCREKYGDPMSIGVDTWGVDFALLKGSKLTCMPYAYRDKRTQGCVEAFLAKMPLERLYSLTGIQVLPFNSLFQLYAMVSEHDPALYSASDILLMADFFNYVLTGVKVSEFTLATTTQLFNPRTCTWDSEIIEVIGVNKSLFQSIKQPGEKIGSVNEETRSKTGVSRIPVVAVACHDTGSAIAAVPSKSDDIAYISSGTWSLMGVESEVPIINALTMKYNFTNEGGVSNKYRVLKNITGLWLLQECRKAWAQEHEFSYDELTKLGEESESLNSIIDPDSPCFSNPVSMPEAIASYCSETHQKIPHTIGEYVRVIVDSLSLAYRYTLSQLEEITGKHINEVHIIGGGSRNGLLCKVTSDATGCIVHAGPSEATCIGNILVQAMAEGRIRDIKNLREVVMNSFNIKTYEPSDSSDWDAQFNKFLDLKKKKSGVKNE